MATISGYDSSSIGVLFSSLNSGSTKTSAMFGTSDLLGISYSDYATIQNGSYTKLMKAYYTKEASGDSSSSSVSATTSTSKDSSKTLANIEGAAEDLKKASETLRTNGDKSLFTKKQTTDKDGNVSYEYDTDKIYSAVKKFADAYNDMIDSGDGASLSGVRSAVSGMEGLTSANSSILKSIGISVGSNGHLSVDEATFKKSDMTVAKSLFQTSGGYGYQISAKASMVRSSVLSQASGGSYTRTGAISMNDLMSTYSSYI